MEKKFRIYDKFRGKWVYSDRFLTLTNFFLNIDTRSLSFRGLEQFIGRKDKTGLDIYIGDKLNWGNQCIILIIEKEDLGFTYEVLSRSNPNATDDLRLYRTEQLAEIIGYKLDIMPKFNE